MLIDLYAKRPYVDENQMHTLFWIKSLFFYGVLGLFVRYQIEEAMKIDKQSISFFYFFKNILVIAILYFVHSFIFLFIKSGNIDGIVFLKIIQEIDPIITALVFVLIQINLLNYIVCYFKVSFIKKFPTLLFTFILLIGYLTWSVLHYPLSTPKLLIHPLFWLFFYHLGTFIADHYQPVLNFIYKEIALFVFLSLVTYLLPRFIVDINRASSALLIAAFIPYSILMILISLNISQIFHDIDEPIIHFLDRFWFPILIISPIIIFIFRPFLGWFFEYTLLYFTVGILTTLGMSSFIIYSFYKTKKDLTGYFKQ